MALSCKLFGHSYQIENTEQREKDKDGNTVLVDYKIRSCSRCSKTKEEKVRTKIRNEETTEEETTENPNNNSNNSNNKYEKSTRFNDTPTEPKTSNSQGGVILKGKEDTGPKSKNQQDSPLLASDPEREFIEEDGAVVYNESKDGDIGRRVRCESCNYSELSYDSARRTGDLCTECGGWLKVEIVHGNNSDEMDSTSE
jgi:hypothetical protein